MTAVIVIGVELLALAFWLPVCAAGKKGDD